MSTTERFVFRAPAELLSSLKDEAEKAGMTPSEFVRRSVEASITWGWVARQADVHVRTAPVGKKTLGMQVMLPSGGCIHPPTAHETRVFDVICGLCGNVLRRL